MMVSELDNFKLLLKIKPQLFINKKVLIDDNELKILDVSLDGSYIFVEKSSEARDWKPISELTKDKVVIDVTQEEFSKEAANTKPLSVNTLTSFMTINRKLQGNEFVDQAQILDSRFIEQLKNTAEVFNVMKDLSTSPLQKVIEQVVENKVASLATSIANDIINTK